MIWQTKEIVDHFGLLDLEIKDIRIIPAVSEKTTYIEYVILLFNVKSFQLRFLKL